MLLNLQYLRLVAALMVVMNHSMSLVLRVGRDDIGQSFEVGAAGVDLFFAISGFIMVYITAGRRVSAGAFLYERIARVVPPYWFVTALMAVLIIFIPHIFENPPLTGLHLLASLFFIPWSETSFAESVPLYLPGWTLNHEMMFYLIFALALSFATQLRILVVAATLSVLVLIGFVLPQTNMIAQFYTHPIILEFVFGMLIGQIVVMEAAPGIAASALIMASGVALLAISTSVWPIWRFSPERVLVWGVPSALIVAGGVFLERHGWTKRIGWLLLLGNASYAIYLTHYFVVGAVGKLWALFHLSRVFSDAFLFATCIGASLAVGLAFHLLFEKTALRLLKGPTKQPVLALP